MSYILNVNRQADWFYNSLLSLPMKRKETLFDHYARAYKVKVHPGKGIGIASAVYAVEFPSEGDALLFILKWSEGLNFEEAKKLSDRNRVRTKRVASTGQ